jgi:iron complex transport system substrate-binding protein
MIRTFLFILLSLLAGCGRPDQPALPVEAPERIISLAPNITETLCELGLENRLVGISRFGIPDGLSEIPVVGDFISLNYETIVALQPDIVILEKSFDDQKARLHSLDIPYLETCSLTINEVLSSIRTIGKACKVENHSEQLIASIQTRMDALENTPAHRPRTIMVFSDFSEQDKVDQIYAFGADCIHSELLAIAGGDNVVTNTHPSVILSCEAVIRLNPELIIELSAGGPTNDWNHLQSIDAVRNRRIYVVDGNYTTIPSPANLLHTLSDLSMIIKQVEFP